MIIIIIIITIINIIIIIIIIIIMMLQRQHIYVMMEKAENDGFTNVVEKSVLYCESSPFATDFNGQFTSSSTLRVRELVHMSLLFVPGCLYIPVCLPASVVSACACVSLSVSLDPPPTPGEDVRQGKPHEKKPPIKFAIFVNGKICMSGTKSYCVAIRQLREEQMGSADSG